MARKVFLCLAVVAVAICVATAQTEPAPKAAAAPAPKTDTKAAAPKAPALPTNSEGGLEKGLQEAVSRASQTAAEAVIKKGGTKEEANAAAGKAAQEVLAAARNGKPLPSKATALTPEMQNKVSAAASKAAEAVVKRGGSQADANAAGAKAAQDTLRELGFSG